MRGHRLLRRPWPLALVLAILVAVTVAVRVPDAVQESLWADEVGSARTITVPSSRAALARVRRESSPPGYFFLGRATHRAGKALADLGAPARLASMDAVRLWSVLFSAVLTALVVIYAARLLPLWGAALAGLLVALGFQFVLHGKELRAYAMLAMLSVAFPLALEAVAARPTLRRLAVLGAVTAVGAMTHYFFLFAVVLGFVWLWLLSGARDARLRATGAVAAGLVPLFVWLPITVFQAGRVNRYFPAFDWGSVFDLHASLFATGLVWRDTGGAGRYVLLAVVLVGALLLARRAEGRLCALMAVGPVVLTAVVWALGLHVFNLRNLIVAGPFAAIAVAAAVTSIPFRPLALAATAALAGLSVWAFTVDSALGRTPYDEISGGVVETGWEPSDPIVLFAPFPQVVPLSWYLPGHPRLRLARPGSGSCRQVVAVVENPAGHAWLESHRDGVLESRRYPFFGYRLASRHREPDVVVARLAWSPELLEDAFRREAFLFRHRLGRPSCLEEKTG